jgi:hypothetical protein
MRDFHEFRYAIKQRNFFGRSGELNGRAAELQRNFVRTIQGLFRRGRLQNGRRWPAARGRHAGHGDHGRQHHNAGERASA